MSVLEAALLAFFAAVLIVIAVIDARTRRIPNRIVLPAALVVLVGHIAIEPAHAAEWTLAALGAFLFLLAAHVVYPAGLGMGDVKLALLLGAALGWAVGPALVLGLLAAGLAGVALIVREGWSARRRTLPLGPFLAVGGIAAAALVLL